MRGYTVITSAVALGVDYKWLDNLLSHHTVTGVRQARQGVSRTIPYSALRIIAAALELGMVAQIPLPHALDWAHRLAGDENPVGDRNVQLSIDFESLDRHLMDRLAYAVEVAPVPRRGRPRKEQ